VLALVLVIVTAVYFLPARPETPRQERSKLVAGQPDTVEVSNEGVELLGISVETVKPAPPVSLNLRGSLALDVKRLVHVRASSAGEVSRIFASFGDRVTKGQKLAQIGQDESRGDSESGIVSPISGTIVEKNVAEGELVGTGRDLFKIADLSVLNAWAHVEEADLSLLQKTPAPITWKLSIPSNKAASPIAATIDRIGGVIDPNERTALVNGAVNNEKGELRAGQAITAVIELPPNPSVLLVPANALIEEQGSWSVFVESSSAPRQFTRRKVEVTRREGSVAFIAADPETGVPGHGAQSLHAGERVVFSGVMALAAKLKAAQLRTAER
jgi:multidrug efflux pump subunit AcrA (membrane-fusion protein)